MKRISVKLVGSEMRPLPSRSIRVTQQATSSPGSTLPTMC